MGSEFISLTFRELILLSKGSGKIWPSVKPKPPPASFVPSSSVNLFTSSANVLNSKLFVTNIEKAYEKIWHHHLNGNKIADIFI